MDSIKSFIKTLNKRSKSWRWSRHNRLMFGNRAFCDGTNIHCINKFKSIKIFFMFCCTIKNKLVKCQFKVKYFIMNFFIFFLFNFTINSYSGPSTLAQCLANTSTNFPIETTYFNISLPGRLFTRIINISSNKSNNQNETLI